MGRGYLDEGYLKGRGRRYLEVRGVPRGRGT